MEKAPAGVHHCCGSVIAVTYHQLACIRSSRWWDLALSWHRWGALTTSGGSAFHSTFATLVCSSAGACLGLGPYNLDLITGHCVSPWLLEICLSANYYSACMIIDLGRKNLARDFGLIHLISTSDSACECVTKETGVSSEVVNPGPVGSCYCLWFSRALT